MLSDNFPGWRDGGISGRDLERAQGLRLGEVGVGWEGTWSARRPQSQDAGRTLSRGRVGPLIDHKGFFFVAWAKLTALPWGWA